MGGRRRKVTIRKRNGAAPGDIGDIEDTLPVTLLRAREAVMNRFRPVLNKHGITEQQWRVLRVLDKHVQTVDASELARRCCLLLPSLTRIVRGLEHEGLLRRQPHTRDKRRVRISITAKGRRQVALIAPEMLRQRTSLYAEIGPEQVRALQHQLDALSSTLLQRTAATGD